MKGKQFENRKTNEFIMIHQSKLIPFDEQPYKVCLLYTSSVRVFATLVCLSNFLPRDRHWNDFIDLIETLLDKYPNVKMELMGFPTNWKDVLI